MDAFRLIAENRIRDAIERGEFDDLPGKGKPLRLHESPFVPIELRAAFRLLQDAGLKPREVDLLRERTALLDALSAEQDPSRRRFLARRLSNIGAELDAMLGRGAPWGTSRRGASRPRSR